MERKLTLHQIGDSVDELGGVGSHVEVLEDYFSTLFQGWSRKSRRTSSQNLKIRSNQNFEAGCEFGYNLPRCVEVISPKPTSPPRTAN
jgi:hypothetical protein